MSRITDCVNTDLPLYADDPRCSALMQSEEILKAIALLEANRFQVHFQPGVDIVGSLNYNIKWVSELLSEKKQLQEEFAEYKKKNPEPEFGRCENCERPLDEYEHIFIFNRGDEDMTMCEECGNDTHEEMKADGWKRDDDEGEINHFEEDEDEEED